MCRQCYKQYFTHSAYNLAKSSTTSNFSYLKGANGTCKATRLIEDGILPSFTDNKLTGSLPASLSSIPSLAGIAFYGNQLTGEIPESYGSFPAHFTGLLLSRNRLSGKIPASLGKLNLADLDLSRNALKGDASMCFKSNISTNTISLAMNSFTFDIGKVGLSKDLNKLDLRNNKIYGTLPEGLANLRYLHKLNVSNNNLCGQIPNLRLFDESCYTHNKCLCGSPLPACKT